MNDSHRTNRILKLQVFFIVMFVIAVVFTKMHERLEDPLSRPRPLANVSDWPEPIKRLYRSLSDAGVYMKSLSVFLLVSGMDESCVFRLDVDDAGWNVIQQKLELQAIPESKVDRLRDSIVSAADSTWWPTSTDHAEYFASAHSLAGGEGDLYCAARNSDTGRVYIYYYFNF